jgi:hypothetical protein
MIHGREVQELQIRTKGFKAGGKGSSPFHAMKLAIPIKANSTPVFSELLNFSAPLAERALAG